MNQLTREQASYVALTMKALNVRGVQTLAQTI